VRRAALVNQTLFGDGVFGQAKRRAQCHDDREPFDLLRGDLGDGDPAVWRAGLGVFELD
jgi:hypothetical protein